MSSRCVSSQLGRRSRPLDTSAIDRARSHCLARPLPPVLEHASSRPNDALSRPIAGHFFLSRAARGSWAHHHDQIDTDRHRKPRDTGWHRARPGQLLLHGLTTRCAAGSDSGSAWGSTWSHQQGRHLAFVGCLCRFALAWPPLCAGGDAVGRVDAAGRRSMIWMFVCLPHGVSTTLPVTGVRLLYGCQRGCLRAWTLPARVVVGVKIIDF